MRHRKIYLKNSSPKNIISWFEEYPPVSGLGKLKLAEALVSINQKDGIKKIIQEGWTIAELTSSELRYYRSKFKSFLSSEEIFSDKILSGIVDVFEDTIESFFRFLKIFS